MNEKTDFTIQGAPLEPLPAPAMAGGTDRGGWKTSRKVIYCLKVILFVCFAGIGITVLCQIAGAQAEFSQLENKLNSLEKVVDPNGTLVHNYYARDLVLDSDGSTSVISATTPCEHTLTPGYVTPGFTTETALPVQGTLAEIHTSYETVLIQTTVTLTSSIIDDLPTLDGYTGTTTITEPSSTTTVTIAPVESGADCSAGALSTVTVYVTATPELVTPYDVTTTSSSVSYVVTTLYTTLTSTIGNAETVITSQLVQTQTEVVTVGLSTTSDDYFETWSVDGATAEASSSSATQTAVTTSTEINFFTATLNFNRTASANGSDYAGVVTATSTSTVIGSHNASFVTATATFVPFSSGDKLAIPAMDEFLTSGGLGIAAVAAFMIAFA